MNKGGDKGCGALSLRDGQTLQTDHHYNIEIGLKRQS
jgi:hypothetical protein